MLQKVWDPCRCHLIVHDQFLTNRMAPHESTAVSPSPPSALTHHPNDRLFEYYITEEARLFEPSQKASSSRDHHFFRKYITQEVRLKKAPTKQQRNTCTGPPRRPSLYG
jgi:hypothetical protein